MATDPASSELVDKMDTLAALALGGALYVGPVAANGDERTVGGQLILATAVANVDLLPAGSTRFTFAKRLIYRFARLFLHRQRDFNLAMINAVADLNQQVAALRSRTATDANRIAATLTHLSLSVEELGDQLDGLSGTLRAEMDSMVRARTDPAFAQLRAEAEANLAQVRADADASLARGAALSMARHDQVDAVLAELNQRSKRIFRIQQGLRASVTVAQADLELLRAGAQLLSGRAATAARAVAPSLPDATPVEAASIGHSTSRADAFYERFEDEHRGSLDDIRERLEPYLDDLDKIRSLGGPVVDVGSGRGEWLDLLVEAGFEAIGVDTNSEAVASTRARGLPVVHDDAIAYLNAMPQASVLAVTFFHVIEHLPAELQVELARAALRALKPGGKLIMETPNPTNLNVGAAAFYLDPTHLRPVNPTYAEFLFTELGFSEIETRFLHPRDGYQPMASGGGDAQPGLDDEIMWALRGPQDYAVIATASFDDDDGVSAAEGASTH
jgi:O-antigen chain-terminating methyltransferase